MSYIQKKSRAVLRMSPDNSGMVTGAVIQCDQSVCRPRPIRPPISAL